MYNFGVKDKELADHHAAVRDTLQAQQQDIRKLRSEQQLKSRNDRRGFFVDLGKLNLTFAAAVAIFLVKDNPVLGFWAITLYILAAVIPLWRAKMILDEDSLDAPFVGLEEEILLQPLINTRNKLITDPRNQDYLNQLVEAGTAVVDAGQKNAENSNIKTVIPDFTSEISIFFFVLATYIMIGAAWPYQEMLYWGGFVLLVVGSVIYGVIEYKRLNELFRNLQKQQKKLADLRADYQNWHKEHVDNKLKGIKN